MANFNYKRRGILKESKKPVQLGNLPKEHTGYMIILRIQVSWTPIPMTGLVIKSCNQRWNASQRWPGWGQILGSVPMILERHQFKPHRFQDQDNEVQYSLCYLEAVWTWGNCSWPVNHGWPSSTSLGYQWSWQWQGERGCTLRVHRSSANINSLPPSKGAQGIPRSPDPKTHNIS